MANLDSKLSTVHVSQGEKRWDVRRGPTLTVTLTLRRSGPGGGESVRRRELGALTGGTEYGCHTG